MRKRTTIILLAILLLAGAVFASGQEDNPCTCDDQECGECTDCTCDSEPCENCSSESGSDDDATCEPSSRCKETSAPIEEVTPAGCTGCFGGGCR